MKWVFGLIALAIAVVLGLWWYGVLGATTVAVAAPERREAIRAVYATGSVKAEVIAQIRSSIGGQVTALPVREGEEVRTGMLVIQIDEREQNAAVTDQTARVKESSVAVDLAQQNLDRETALLAQGGSSQQAVDDARGVLNRASATLRTVRASLAVRRSLSGRGKIVSPITGVVTKVNANVGDVVPANFDAVTIIDPSSFKVVADIDELDIARIQPGQEAIIAFDAIPRSRFMARVERIVPQTDPVTKTVRVFLNLVDYVPNLSDGLTATVNIVQERRANALTVPAAALLSRKGPTDTLFVVTERNTIERRAVRTGVRGEDYIEILSGLHDEERVALNPDPAWSDGRSVEIELRKSPRRAPSPK